MHRFRIARNQPVLSGSVPVGQVPPRDVGGESCASTSWNSQSVKVAEDNLGIVGSSQADVELRDFVTCYRSGIRNGRCGCEQNIVQFFVATRSDVAAGWHVWLRTAIGASAGEAVVEPILWVAR